MVDAFDAVQLFFIISDCRCLNELESNTIKLGATRAGVVSQQAAGEVVCGFYSMRNYRT